jgi:hypothetical protein
MRITHNYDLTTSIIVEQAVNLAEGHDDQLSLTPPFCTYGSELCVQGSTSYIT